MGVNKIQITIGLILCLKVAVAQVNTNLYKNEDVFSSRINYENGLNPKYNGTISSYEWTQKNDQRVKYDFNYDDHDQLIKADHSYYHNNQYSGSPGSYALREIKYDLNGNILLLQRNGQNISANAGIYDNLHYTYDNSNRLTNLIELGDGSAGYKPKDWWYWGNGQISYDNNGNITYMDAQALSIKYNSNNLPVEFIFDNQDTLRIYYDALGRKYLKESINSSGQINRKHYTKGIEFVNGDLESIRHSEGRTLKHISDFQNEFVVKDHLGNARAYFADLDHNGLINSNTEILQKEEYYPFGAEKDDWGTVIGVENYWQYSSKEKIEDFGLDWIDFGARYYIPSIGRWNSVDPLAENYKSWSPYNYTLNNPMTFIDPDGRSVWIPDADGNLIAEEGDNANTLATFLFGEDTEYNVLVAEEILEDQGCMEAGCELNLKPGKKIMLNNNFTEALALSNRFSTYSIEEATFDLVQGIDGRFKGHEVDYYNCWGAAVAGSDGERIEKGVGISYGADFDAILKADYELVSPDEAIFGKTIIRFAIGNQVTHGAVYYGKDQVGHTYYFSKDGWYIKPRVERDDRYMNQMRSLYGQITGYYNPKKPN
ncbi:MAG: RHS repeat-associated core domain-containing protein [Flavobacteriales bacterium]|nr:RHS repeat-associated core domain-containing protein [Flavobacteriales bacterium]